MAGIRKKKEMLDQLLRQEIVQVILTMIEEETPITMDEAARQCGVSKGTLYNYFQNKDELLDHVHQIVLEPVQASHQDIFESDLDSLGKINAFIDMVFGHSECISTYFQFIWQNKTAENVFRERVEMLIHPLAKLCREGADKGELPDVNPYVLAELLYGTIIGPLASLPYRDVIAVNREEMQRDVKVLINKLFS